ncbi:MAG: tRNA (adenosine(37)-N6)-dimethylallyltransferase MiaA [Winogradskyella sp.]|uniref:tRNA (adenosine(37)-N6)-dimethylallyltransferase MiaA n=1 Tax=Winogradskyella sp. TaxID=1883156 RepID=UPI0017E2950F|nr:tRNA (adenosine(37)-N6)-dimethylallyltransferase MiaA [Winogradskyella sp.]MBT8245850.1 tRNA (adenosine(37)-N6)-dimethylallyltransferase MiaA [Winogradskyella sp.]NNK21849.1 tRNA (adenosine(37)-N6)-dimethylallyltransferase MiaA [Winogradskyella sp.]
MNKILISIVGPTGIGKTALSLKLANYFKTEIISSDSRQFFKEMTIGTAVPSKEELNAAKHHFIQHIAIKDHYSVGQFEKDAIHLLEKLFQKYNILVMVGGSGLYSNAVINGLDQFPQISKDVRESLNKKLQEKGLEYLQKQLKQLDKKSFETIAIDNPKRVIRALEICLGTGKPYSTFLSKEKKKRNFQTIQIGINADREIIYNRINRRVDIMLENGLLEEAKALLPNKNLNALNTVGYKELFKHFEGEWPLDYAISEIKKNTRRFAKRQLTWYRRDETIKWFDYLEDVNHIIDYIKNEKPA